MRDITTMQLVEITKRSFIHLEGPFPPLHGRQGVYNRAFSEFVKDTYQHGHEKPEIALWGDDAHIKFKNGRYPILISSFAPHAPSGNNTPEQLVYFLMLEGKDYRTSWQQFGNRHIDAFVEKALKTFYHGERTEAAEKLHGQFQYGPYHSEYALRANLGHLASLNALSQEDMRSIPLLVIGRNHERPKRTKEVHNHKPKTIKRPPIGRKR